MTPRERFICALERRPIVGQVPHFELVFFLTMEAFGKVHPSHRRYHQWHQMDESERAMHRKDISDLCIRTAESVRARRNFPAPESESRGGDPSND